MDFLASVKKKLEELEEQARLMQLAQAPEAAPVTTRDGNPLFRPRKAALPNPASVQRKPGANEGSRVARMGQGPPALPQQRRGGGQEAFATPECPMAAGGQPAMPQSPGFVTRLRPRLVDDLHGRLDEAFLLSEILGAPRCVRGWDDDD